MIFTFGTILFLKPEFSYYFFRINLDLRVEKESLKNEIEEKNKLLEDAYIALDILEKVLSLKVKIL